MDKNAKSLSADTAVWSAAHVCASFRKKAIPISLPGLMRSLIYAIRRQSKSSLNAEKPEYVILAGAKVGGIMANKTHPAEFLLENLEIQNNVISQSFLNKVKKFCFLGSSCIYPCKAQQPIKEEYLLTGPLEPTNEGYALAKIAGYKLCYYLAKQYGFNAVSLMPCNLYGTNDNYDPENSHVFPGVYPSICRSGGQ